MKKLLVFFSSVLVLTACANTAPQQSTLVYINTGAIQCQTDGKTGAETAGLLTQQDIAVSNTQCGHLSNVMVLAMCGGIATNINVHKIAAADLEKAQSLGFEDVATLLQEDNLGYDVGDCK